MHSIFYLFLSGTPPKINKPPIVKEDKSTNVAKKRKLVDEKEGQRSHESPKKKKKKNESGYGSSLQLDDVRYIFIYYSFSNFRWWWSSVGSILQ